MLLLADVCWIFDVLLNFRTGFFSGDAIVLDGFHIAKTYLASWFLLDLAAASLPTALTPSSLSGLIVIKLVRVLRFDTYFRRLQKDSRYIRVAIVVKVVLSVILISHIASCLWRLAQHADGMRDDADGPWTAKYVADFYWVLMTMTTVGYGDIFPTGTISRLCAVGMMLIAPVFFGTVVSTLTHVTQGWFDDEVEKRVAMANNFLSRRKVPKALKNRVEHNLRHYLHQEHQSRLDPQLFAMLTPAVQRDLSLTLLNNTVLRFPLFQDTPHAFVAELAGVHSWVICTPSDLVVEEEQLVQEVVFVVTGCLLAQYSASQEGFVMDVKHGNHDEADRGSNAVVRAVHSMGSHRPRGSALSSATSFYSSDAGVLRERELAGGAWFGESCLVDTGRIYVSSVFALTDSELAVLTATDYKRVVSKYPRLMRRHRDIVQAVRTGIITVEELGLAYVPSDGAGAPEHAMRGKSFFSLLRQKMDGHEAEEGTD